MSHPVADDAECCSAHMRCKLAVHTPVVAEILSAHKESSKLIKTMGERSDLQGSHADNLIGVIKEVGQDIKDGRFRQNEFL